LIRGGTRRRDIAVLEKLGRAELRAQERFQRTPRVGRRTVVAAQSRQTITDSANDFSDRNGRRMHRITSAR
jgi:hypothetical protein